MKRILLIAALIVAPGACGGGTKQGATTPSAGSGSGSGSGDPSMSGSGVPGTPASAGGNDTAGGGGGGGNAGGGTPDSGNPVTAPPNQGPPIIFPNQDPDPATVRAQVDQHLNIARSALSAPTPDADTALREAREALKLDAANLDAAAMIAFAYYHKKQFDTAELVLDDLFKRPAAKENANVLYVYGLVYDKTNRPEQAVLAFQKAVQIKPDFASALVDLGVHQLQNKQYAEAQATFEKLTGMGRNDAVTLTSLASAYRGRSGDYAPGTPERNQYITQAEAGYKKALSVDSSYGPAYYNLALLYLDSDPFPSGGGTLDTMARLNAAKTYMDQYKNMAGVDMKLFDQREKEIDKAVKRAQKAAKKAAKAGKGGAP
ncbi:MAG TPA: tetratricopeptide repeat protein [Kofleriaceae bacterium]|nr:tetratricopeptide repeat protein [Kofleriaceae bacterium]